MRNVFVTALTALILVPASWAGDDKDSKKNNTSDTTTIRGVVAGITVEGETAIDLRTNAAMTVEAAFLTVVGMPADDKDKDDNAARAADSKSGGGSDKVRANVYLIWMTPRTKICEKTSESGKSDANKKDCSFDQLEVGDRVEIEFNRREESGANAVSAKTEQSRKTHGRHRTFSGYATSISILPTRLDWGRDRDNPASTAKDSSSTEKNK